MLIRNLLIYLATYIGIFIAVFYILSMKEHKKIKKDLRMPKVLPFVSIIIPAFNEEKGIYDTIKRVLKIDYPKNKYEIIVVDDGSRDKTYKIAKSIKDKNLKVYRLEKNSGKGAAMNYGLSKSIGELVVTIDADNTFVTSGALKKVIPYFNNSEVMCVSPAMGIYKPKGFLQRVQQVEYMFGVFLRKALSTINAVHITPGAFSAYRRKFFDLHGGFDEDNLTEDMEMSLRIQYHQYVIENEPSAVIYAIAPKKFIPLMKQRRRWYSGLVKNLWKYKSMFSRKYGVLGTVVLPLVVFSVFMSMALVIIMVMDTLMTIKDEIILWQGVNFDFMSTINFNKYLLERYIFLLFSNPVMIFSSILLIIFLGYMYFAKRNLTDYQDIKFSLFFFLVAYSLLFVFWWIVSLFHVLLNKKISWR